MIYVTITDKQVLASHIAKAIELGGKRNFKQSVEIVIVLKDIDLKSQQLKIREAIYLPRGRGRDLRVCVVGDVDISEAAREAGAHRVILSTELKDMNKKQAKKIASECDWVLVKPDLMGMVGRVLGPALGPRGKIPIPIPSGSVLKTLISRYKNTVLVKIKDQPVLMTSIGVEDMKLEDLAENALAVISAIEGKLPARLANIGKVFFKTTMGIPVEITL